VRPAARILPCLAASIAVHGALLLGAPTQWSLAIAPSGNARSISVDLVPAGASQTSRAAPGRHQPRSHVKHAAPRPKPATASTQTASAEPAQRQPEPTPTAVRRQLAQAASRPRPTTPAPARRLASRSAKHAATTTHADSARKTPPPTPTKKAASTAQAISPAPHTHGAHPARTRLAQSGDRPDGHATASGKGGDHGRAATASEARRVRKQVVARLKRFFRYPPIARRRGWEGRVVLTFRILPGGRITGIKVVETSGRAVLDQAAVHALEQVKHVPGLPEHALGAPLALRLPVTYHLQPA